MIQVRVREHKLTVSGHAGYAPKGQDIVCAAVSSLTLTLILGLTQVAGVELKSMEESGYISIEWQHMNEIGKALIGTWFLGISSVAESYNCIQFL